MAVIDDIKTLKPDNDLSDGQLSLKIRMAETAISKYLNNNLDNSIIEINYPDAVIQCVIEALNRIGDEGIKTSNISSIQTTYEIGISETVKSLLPLPKIRYIR
jgi:hypothetical protein